MRRAVTLGATILALLIVADLATNLVVGTPGVAALAPYELAAAAVSTLVGIAARHGRWPGEPLALVLLLVASAVILLGLALAPTGRLLGSAQLATLLVGTGLILPWSQRWHLAAIGSAIGVVVIAAIGPLDPALAGFDRLSLVAAVIIAGVTSVIGHGLWQVRMRAMLEQQFSLRNLSRYAQRQEAQVSELNRELNRVARRDSLTGVGNRYALDEAIARLLEQGDRVRPVRFALALLDIDHFKAYNDEHGHLAGDAALGYLGQVLRSATRSRDLAFRYGGEEFLLLLPDIDLTGALAVAERVRVAVESPRTPSVPSFTISAGVALCDPADGRDPEPLLRRADAALYIAKRSGRNRIAADELSVAMQRQELAAAG
ncbi:MAG TPA: GGDEF domain-containing protein [Patescibacteria group bacterium]|nr:GGDEF domain-containing protein [Patescibacteria group bacterium]